MIHKRFTLSSAYEEIELHPKPKDGYDTIQEVIDWCNEEGVECYDVRITEWNIDDEFDGYGVPDIIASVNLQNVLMDGETEDLGRYSTY